MKTQHCVATEHVLQCQAENTTVREGPGQINEKRKIFLKEIKKHDLQTYEEQGS